MTAMINKLWKDESGTATLEYALVLGLVILAAMGIVGMFGTRVLARWTSVNSTLH